MKSFLLRNAVWIGAIVGALLLQLVSALELAAFTKLRDPRLGLSLSDLVRIVFSVRTPLDWFKLLTRGAVLGAASACLFGAWKRKDRKVAMRCLWIGALFGLVEIARVTFPYLNFLDSPYTRMRVGRALVANATLQWSIALAVWARIAANRVKREAARRERQ